MKKLFHYNTFTKFLKIYQGGTVIWLFTICFYFIFFWSFFCMCYLISPPTCKTALRYLWIYNFPWSKDPLQPVLASLLKILKKVIFREIARIVFNQISRSHGIAKLTHKISHPTLFQLFENYVSLNYSKLKNNSER